MNRYVEYLECIRLNLVAVIIFVLDQEVNGIVKLPELSDNPVYEFWCCLSPILAVVFPFVCLGIKMINRTKQLIFPLSFFGSILVCLTLDALPFTFKILVTIQKAPKRFSFSFKVFILAPYIPNRKKEEMET